MTIPESRKMIINEISGIYDPSEAVNIAVLVIEFITGLNRSAQLAERGKELSPKENDLLQDTVKRLRLYEPIQYITSISWFAGMQLQVNSAVLIPRPETEELVEWILASLENTNPGDQQVALLDIGTGSGCIPIALKKRNPAVSVTGIDNSEKALQVAKKNAADQQVQVELIHLDFLDETVWDQLPVFDILVSNPPYIPLQERATLHRNVLDHEPHNALFVADDNPLIFYQAIAAFAKKHLSEGGEIYLEIHENTGKEVLQFFQSQGYQDRELKKDMQGRDRMIRVLK
ncbi:MAG: peptide chain release factor N(5)-glutamine methyltransferase [Terrimonas sp.]|nr:peptide chain release factor N(5)-glutamine methyltransferase [Terrimonas sp.]